MTQRSLSSKSTSRFFLVVVLVLQKRFPSIEKEDENEEEPLLPVGPTQNSDLK